LLNKYPNNSAIASVLSGEWTLIVYRKDLHTKPICERISDHRHFAVKRKQLDHLMRYDGLILIQTVGPATRYGVRKAKEALNGVQRDPTVYLDL